ncbi:MAG: presqualene diphosphate synthase HpnD [Alphaproteobacteria bacterium]|nr:presqualene diphosphate synthase HpnD [Alphaproteobacteria bacterium]
MTLARPVVGPGTSDVRTAGAQAGAGRRGSSFYWAMRLLPRDRREAMFAVYAFCRAVDDIADGPGSDGAKRMALAAWRHRIEAMYAGAPDHPVTGALAGPVAAFGLARDDFLAVIEGMEMDVSGRMVAPSVELLALYCDRAASAVGRLSARVFGLPHGVGDRLAGCLGQALQLTNLLRDLADDGAAGRLYLPREILAVHGIAHRAPAAALADPAIARVCADLVAMAEAHFAAAWAELGACPRGRARPARVMARIYGRLLARLKARGFAPEHLCRPVRLTAAEKLVTALVACLR